MASKSRTLYTGITSNLDRRVLQHRDKRFEGFTGRYNINRLVYFEKFGDVRAAIVREKQIKAQTQARFLAASEGTAALEMTGWESVQNNQGLRGQCRGR